MQRFFVVILFSVFSLIAYSQTVPLADSVEVYYDTIYAPDTIRQSEELIVYETEEYVLDLATGFAAGYVQPFMQLRADSTMNAKGLFGWTAEIPFRANFRPLLIESGIAVQQLAGNRELHIWTPHTDTLHKMVTDTLDVYYIIRNGVTRTRAITRQRDSMWTETKNIHSQSQQKTYYTWLTVPLLIGYQKDWKRCFVSASAGAYFSFLLKQGSNNAQSDGKQISSETDEMLHRWNVWPTVQVSLMFPISERCDLAVQTNGMFSAINQFSSEKYSFHIQQLAVKFAFFYHF